MNLVDILTDALKIGAAVYPPLAPFAVAESAAAPALKDLSAAFATPEGKKVIADVEAVFVKHNTNSHAIANALGSARGRLVTDRDQVMIDKTAG